MKTFVIQNIIMDVFFVFILSMKFVSLVQSADKIPCVWCGFGGTELRTGYTFKISDVPDRCEAVVYGSEYFDTEPSTEDTTAITALVAAKKIVYVFYTKGQNADWNGIMSSNDESSIDKLIAPMIAFLNKSKVTGVILSYLQLLAGEIPDYATKIKSIICKVKAGVPNIKVGLLISGWMAKEFSNAKIFDFKVTNDVVDVYVIDTTTAEANCTATTMADGGRFPITSTVKGVVSLDQISQASKNSPMDQNKVIIYFADFAIHVINGEEWYKPYTEYCKRSGKDLWCGDTMQMFYDNVKHVKSNFKGILMSGLDQDDFDNSCGCGKFSVANTYIDAWLDKPITCCPKI